MDCETRIFSQFRKIGQLNALPYARRVFKQKLNLGNFGVNESIGEIMFIVGNFVNSLRNCNDIPSFGLSILTMYTQLCKTTYTNTVHLYGSYITEAVKQAFGSLTDCFDSFVCEYPMKAQSSTFDSFNDFIGLLRKALRSKDKLIKCEFGQRLSSFLSILICTPFFRKRGLDATWFGFSPIFDRSLKYQYKKEHPLSIVDSVLDNIAFILEKVMLVIKTGNTECIWVDDIEYEKFATTFDDLMLKSDRLDLVGNDGIKLDDLQRQVDGCLCVCSKLIGISKHDPIQYKILKSQYAALTKLMYRINDKLKVRSEREPPLAFALIGPPGIGKSALIDKLLTILHQNEILLGRSNIPFDPKSKYYMNNSQKFMDGFRIECTSIILDDMGQFLKEYLLADGGGAARYIIDFINSVPYITNQAEIENKGLIPFLCKYVLLTSNEESAGIREVFKEISGALRRFLFFKIRVKEKYRKPGTTSLLGDLENPNNQDLHEFLPYKFYPEDQDYTKKYYDVKTDTWCEICTENYMSLSQVTKFLYKEQQKHYEQCDIAKGSTDLFINSPICTGCNLNKTLCECLVAQGSRFETLKTLCEQTDLTWENSDIDVVKFTLLLPLYLIASQIFGYHSDFIFDRMMVCLPSVTDNPLAPWFKYLPRNLQKYYFVKYWSKEARVNIKYAERIKVATAVQFGVIVIMSMISMYFIMKSTAQYFVAQSSDFEDVSSEEEEVKVDYKVDKTTSKPMVKPWVNNHVSLTRLSGVQSTISFENLRDVVLSNSCFTRIYIDFTRSFFTRALGLYSNTIVLPYHNFDRINLLENFEIDLIRSDLNNGIGSSRFKVKIPSDCITINADRDLLYITHPGLGIFRDIRPYINNNVDGLCDGVMVRRSENGTISFSEVDGLQKSNIIYKCGDKSRFCIGYSAFLKPPSIDGDCGCPYIMRTNNGAFIAGIHIAGSEEKDRNRVNILPLEHIEINKECFQAHSSNGIDLNDTYETIEDLSIQPYLHAKDPLLELRGLGTIYGTLKVPRRKMKSAVKRTIFCEEVLEHYNMLDTDYFSPKEISSREAAKVNLEKMLVKPNIPFNIILMVSGAMYVWYSRVIKETRVFIPNKPFDVATGINGIDGSYYYNRLPLPTSGGFAHKGRKEKYLIKDVSLPEHEVNYVFSEPIKKEHCKMLDNYKKGVRNDVIWDHNFKDEPLSAEKIRKNKCRIFNSGPMAFMVLVRQYFLWCIPLFSGDHRCKYGMAIGANCYSSDWNDIYNHVTKHGRDRIIAGDYKSFDKSMPPEMMMCAFNVLIKIAKDYGWSEEDIRVMRGIATDICYPISNCFGTLIEFFGSNPSGHPLTTPINGMCNIMYIMIAVYNIAEHSKIDIKYDYFLNHVSIVTYGDDNIMSSAHDEINHNSISSALMEYGIEYTLSDKSEGTATLRSIFDERFLKRNFRPNVNIKGLTAAQLDEDSIIKMQTVYVESKSITSKQQHAEITLSALREYFQYGKKKFNYHREFLNSLVDKYNLAPYLPNNALPTYEEMYDLYCAPLKAQSSDIEYESFNDIMEDEHSDLDEISREMRTVTCCAYSYILFFFGPRLRTININYVPGLSVQQFGLMCAINDELHMLLEEMWLYRISTHYGVYKYVLEDIRKLPTGQDGSPPLMWGDLDLESL